MKGGDGVTDIVQSNMWQCRVRIDPGNQSRWPFMVYLQQAKWSRNGVDLSTERSTCIYS